MKKVKNKDKELRTDLRTDNRAGSFSHAVASPVPATPKPIHSPNLDVLKMQAQHVKPAFCGTAGVHNTPWSKVTRWYTEGSCRRRKKKTEHITM